MKELILTSIASYVFIMWAGSSTENNVMFIVLTVFAYICSLAFMIFAFTNKEKNGCLLVFLGFVPLVLSLIVFPISIPVILFFLNKQKEIRKQESENNANYSVIEKFIKDCKQEGTLENIKSINTLIEQNIHVNGSNIDFLYLNFSILKIYNYLGEKEEINVYTNKILNIISYLNYEDLSNIAKSSVEKNNYRDAIFFYTYILLYNKINDKNVIPETYYDRALAYLGLNQVFYKHRAIEDIKTAIDKTKEISNTLSYLEVEAFLEGKIDKYNSKIGEIYQDIKEYSDAINYYTQVEKDSTLYAQIQEKITECEKEQTAKNERQANAIYKRALEEYESGQFIMAEQTIITAIKLVNKDEFNNLLKNIRSGTRQDKKLVKEEKTNIKPKIKEKEKTKPSSKNKKIKLESCDKADLLSIDGFDEEKADRFIKERDNGKMYFEIDSFVADYGLMPHQMINIQDRLIFPPKPKNKMGRKIDW
mgnify:CR=1 FL=1